jgi:putative sterol carrier protein
MQKLLAGKLNPTMAFMSGKFKVAGDVAVALKVSKWLS